MIVEIDITAKQVGKAVREARRYLLRVNARLLEEFSIDVAIRRPLGVFVEVVENRLQVEPLLVLDIHALSSTRSSGPEKFMETDVSTYYTTSGRKSDELVFGRA